MHIITSNINTGHAYAWPESETPFVEKVSYEPYINTFILKSISLNILERSCIIDGEKHHMDIKTINDFQDIIFFWK